MSLRPDRREIARLEWWHALWERSHSRYVQYPTFLLSQENTDLLEIMEREPVVEDLLVLLEMIGFCSHFAKQFQSKLRDDSHRVDSVRRFIQDKNLVLPMYAAANLWSLREETQDKFETCLRDVLELVFDNWTDSNRVAAAVVDGRLSRELSMRNAHRISDGYYDPYSVRDGVSWNSKGCRCKIKLKELRKVVR